ncbi:MAG: FAD:protein FMN transferase [Candidatus Dormibacteraceae bacterium]
MGTRVRVLVEPEAAPFAFPLVRELFRTWHGCLTRFAADSELSRLNAAAGQLTVVSPLLLTVVECSLSAAAETEGLFDPCLLPQLLTLGYEGSFDDLRHDADPVGQVQPGGDWRSVELNAGSSTIRLPPGSGLDLGGIAKGMAVDRALELLREAGVRAAAVEAGGDLAVLGRPPGQSAWPVAIDACGAAAGQAVEVAAGGLATSTVERRWWMRGGVRQHHLIDPRSGHPSNSGIIAASVAASDCTRAEVGAKVALLLGADAGLDFLARLGLQGRLTRTDGGLLLTANWPDPNS